LHLEFGSEKTKIGTPQGTDSRSPPAPLDTQMQSKLVQKHRLKGTREFEIVDDTIEYRMSGPFANEELTVVLSVLAPEPVVDGEMVYFVSEVNREPLVKLFNNLPDAATFTEFTGHLQRRIKEEDFGQLAAENRQSEITREQIETTIHMLETYVDPTGIKELLPALRSLREAPNDPQLLNQVVTAFNHLGVTQGQVLTYAPFFNTLLASTDLDDLS